MNLSCEKFEKSVLLITLVLIFQVRTKCNTLESVAASWEKQGPNHRDL